MNNLFPIITAALLLSSCVETIVMDPLEEMPVVVNCVLTRDGQGPEVFGGMTFTTPEQKLYLYYAKSPSGGDYMAIKDAEVTVSEKRFTYKFKWNGECWTSSFLPEFDTEYTLNITLPDGRTLSAGTVYPEQLHLETVPLFMYPGMERVLADWKRLVNNYYQSPSRDAFLWVIPGNENDRHFITDHSGADNANVVQGSWKDLPVCAQIDSSVNSWMYRTFFENGQWDYGYWEDYSNRCSSSPLHEGYLRIRHPAGYDNQNDNAVFQWVGSKVSDSFSEEVIIDHFSDAFLLLGDHYEQKSLAEDFGFLTMPAFTFSIRFLSEEYDAYLNSIVHARLGSDELAASYYSPDANYTNINGGIGVFGAIY